jgi:RNA ligase
MKIDMEEVYKDVLDGFLTVREHPKGGLHIINYTLKTQFERAWNDLRIMCRGLIVDSLGNVVARPFPKFFNHFEEESHFPDEPYEVLEKMDGSLGILYFHNGTPAIATRGSFDSEQAIHATKILRRKMAATGFRPESGFTYLFEIIYPENRIVVDYGDTDELILLAILNTETGRDISRDSAVYKEVTEHFRETVRIRCGSLESLINMDGGDNREGFVVRFLHSDYRVKIKFQKYFDKHRVYAHLSAKMILDELKEHDNVNRLLESAPDEFHPWIKMVVKSYRGEHFLINEKCRDIALLIRDNTKIRKAQAEQVFDLCPEYSGILFKMLDWKFDEASRMVWNFVPALDLKPEIL